MSNNQDAFQNAAEIARSGSYKQALAEFRALRFRDPGNVEVLFMIGACHYRMGNFEEARETWAQVLHEEPGHAKASRWLNKLPVATGAERGETDEGRDSKRIWHKWLFAIVFVLGIGIFVVDMLQHPYSYPFLRSWLVNPSLEETTGKPNQSEVASGNEDESWKDRLNEKQQGQPSDSVRTAGGYPAPVDEYVNDYAGVIRPEDAKAIRDQLGRVEYQTGIEITVVTIGSIRDYGTADSSIESFATRLFNDWGIGQMPRNDGVLILAAIQDRKCRIELGAGYGFAYNSVMKDVIDGTMIPHFKADNYSQGLKSGAFDVVGRVTQPISWYEFHKWHIAVGALIVICIIAGISCMISGKTGWGWIFFMYAAALLMLLIKMLQAGHSSRGWGGGGSSFGGGFSAGGGASGSW
ncbi:MAG: TPM domain-containing protein [Candidatus Omnitrophica bacterium]|nr:TPM domain-containing protein [Candidatus Omnitrophota bacterium]